MFDRNVIYIQRRQRSLKPININSVLVIFSVNLFAVSQRFMLSKSSFREDWMEWILPYESLRRVSSAHILGSEWDKQLGKSLMYIAKTVKALILFPGEYHTWGATFWQYFGTLLLTFQQGIDYHRNRLALFGAGYIYLLEATRWLCLLWVRENGEVEASVKCSRWAAFT